jgi:cytochrome subunit of sulfide dehydrogenase
MYRLALALAAAAGTLAPVALGAPSSEATLPRDLAATCANCHGTNGVSAGGFVSLAGTAKDELSSKMREYKSGTRAGTVMPQLAKGYSDAQIDLMAGWFAVQKPAR